MSITETVTVTKIEPLSSRNVKQVSSNGDITNNFY